jgi:hypothetical protein
LCDRFSDSDVRIERNIDFLQFAKAVKVTGFSVIINCVKRHFRSRNVERWRGEASRAMHVPLNSSPNGTLYLGLHCTASIVNRFHENGLDHRSRRDGTNM